LGALPNVAKSAWRHCSELGIDGVALSGSTSRTGLKRFNEGVMPLLERRGLRDRIAEQRSMSLRSKNAQSPDDDRTVSVSPANARLSMRCSDL